MGVRALKEKTLESRARLVFLLIVVLFLLWLPQLSPVKAQPQVEWEKTYGGKGDDWGLCVQQTSDGGYIIVGRTDSFGASGYDVYLVKTDAYGNIVWSKTYGGEGEDVGFCVQQTSDGGYIIVGSTGPGPLGAGNGDVYLIKTDSNGNMQWSKTYGGEKNDFGYCVRQTSDGGYIIVGETSSFGEGRYDVYLVKTDAYGNIVWSKTYGGKEDDWGHCVRQTSDGGYIIVGATKSFGAGNEDVYLIKLGGSGGVGKREGAVNSRVVELAAFILVVVVVVTILALSRGRGGREVAAERPPAEATAVQVSPDALRAELERYEDYLRRLEELKAGGKVSEQVYQALKKEYEAKVEELRRALEKAGAS